MQVTEYYGGPCWVRTSDILIKSQIHNSDTLAAAASYSDYRMASVPLLVCGCQRLLSEVWRSIGGLLAGGVMREVSSFIDHPELTVECMRVWRAMSEREVVKPSDFEVSRARRLNKYHCMKTLVRHGFARRVIGGFATNQLNLLPTQQAND